MPRRVAITGAGGRLGGQLVASFRRAGHDILPLALPEFDLTSSADLRRLTDWNPEIVINCAAWTDVDACAQDPERAMLINAKGAGAVAEAAARAGAAVVQVSTNEVFDGTIDRPYLEADEPQPINPYGASKLAGERLVAQVNPHACIVRTAWLFGQGTGDFVTRILEAARQARAADQPVRVVSDEWGNPTWIPSLADAMHELLRLASLPPVIHLAGHPATSRFNWAAAILAVAGVDHPLEPISSAEYRRRSTPPQRAVLSDGLARRLGITRLEWQRPLGAYVTALGDARVPASGGNRC